MNFLNNILDNDYVFFPLWVGVTGFLGYAWWTKSVEIFTIVNNQRTSPITSWSYDWSADRITDVTPTLLKFERKADFESRLQALDRIQENIRSISNKLDELKPFLSHMKSSSVVDRTVELTPIDPITKTIWPYMDTFELAMHPLTPQTIDLASTIQSWPLVWPFI